MPANILLLDDHAIVLDGLEAILGADPSYHISAKVTDGRMALAYLRTMNIQLVITDYAMPELDGSAFVKQLKQEHPTIKVIMLSMHDEGHVIREVLAAGADGYVLKKYARQELQHAIETVLSGRQYWSQEVSRALLRSAEQPDQSQETLTKREIDVLRLLADQLSNKAIAVKLFIGERTVETHRKNLMRKTGSANMAGLIRYAYDHKLIS